MHALDVAAIGSLASKALAVRDGEGLPFGDDVQIRMLHTPGHTDGSSCYLFRSTVFTGDTLFAGSVGGAFGDDSTYDDILNSVRSKLFTLPDDTVVMPGHGPPDDDRARTRAQPVFSARLKAASARLQCLPRSQSGDNRCNIQASENQ